YKWDNTKELVVKVKAFDKKEFNNTAFSSVHLDSDNSIWMFNILEGIVLYNTVSGTLTKYPLPHKIDLSKFVLSYTNTDDAGNIWLKLGSKTDPYIVFNKHSGKYSEQFINASPHAIFFEKDKQVLAYDDKLIYQYNDNKPAVTIPKMIDGKKISFYSFDGISDHYGRLWMTARGNGLFYYDEKNNRFHQFHHDNSKIKSLPFDLTTCLFIDRNENLWIGMDGAGVVKLDLKQPKFNLFPLSEGDFPVLNDYFTKCFFEDSTGRIWFGTHTGGLNIFDPAVQTLKNYRHKNQDPKSLPANIVASILKDRDGNMWIGSSGGISIFHEKENLFETIAIQDLPELYPLRNNFVYKIAQLANGDLLAATLLGIVKVQKQKSGKYKGYYFSNKPFLMSGTTDIVEMPDKTVYATLPGLGLYQLIPQENNYKLVSTFLNGIDLRSVRMDEKNAEYLWIGSGIGLIHFNTITHAYKVWNEKDGIANSYVYGSLEDATGNLWISTNKGLSFFKTKENSFENFSFEDGLQSNEYNTQAFYKSKSGTFYFGGIKGFNWFKPGQVSKEKIKPVAAITRIEINDAVFQKDAAFLSDNTITVPYDKNDFSFQFAALDYTRPEANNIQYTLQNWDEDWVVADNRSARYSNLPPGNYTLKLKVSNADDTWSDEEKINIIIDAPFWKRPWFIALMAMLFIATIILITYRFSQQKAKRKLQLLEKRIAVDEERNRISADMHDEIGSGITHIALISELIQTQQK
ncbi:MAG: two-component regulator propeller domain-containing protein, partial [Ferruginibacter sp.]